VKTALVNIGQIVSGNWRAPVVAGNVIVTDAGRITHVGDAASLTMEDCDVVIDADGAIVMPGLIDSHVHITFGDYTPRQKTVGFLESYAHGGVTTSITASEVHVPGRPKDPAGVKALAIAAKKSFDTFRPGGMRVHAGAVILEPGLTRQDFFDLADAGVWLAKAGFGAFPTPFGYVEQVGWAKEAGLITLCHTGGSSIPGSSGIWADHLLAMQPDVSFHTNGGPVAMPDADFPRLVNDSTMALQICTAGNLRTALLLADLAIKANAFDRFVDRDRHADRQRHHAARHVLYHLPSREPWRRTGDARHRRCDRQQCARLQAQFWPDRAGPRRRSCYYRCRRRRLQGRCALSAHQRRHSSYWRSDYRRRSALRRTLSQHACYDTNDPGRSEQTAS